MNIKKQSEFQTSLLKPLFPYWPYFVAVITAPKNCLIKNIKIKLLISYAEYTFFKDHHQLSDLTVFNINRVNTSQLLVSLWLKITSSSTMVGSYKTRPYLPTDRFCNCAEPLYGNCFFTGKKKTRANESFLSGNMRISPKCPLPLYQVILPTPVGHLTLLVPQAHNFSCNDTIPWV